MKSSWDGGLFSVATVSHIDAFMTPDFRLTFGAIVNPFLTLHVCPFTGLTFI